MNRRGFFRRMLGLLGAGAVPPVGGVAVAAERTLLLQESPLAGFQYHRGEAVWQGLRVGDLLEPIREPENRYDGRAVALHWRGHKLGYLPRVENCAASQMMDRGERLAVRIVGLTESPDPWRRVRVAVEVRV